MLVEGYGGSADRVRLYLPFDVDEGWKVVNEAKPDETFEPRISKDLGTILEIR
jgi:hypothetical protein